MRSLLLPRGMMLAAFRNFITGSPFCSKELVIGPTLPIALSEKARTILPWSQASLTGLFDESGDMVSVASVSKHSITPAITGVYTSPDNRGNGYTEFLLLKIMQRIIEQNGAGKIRMIHGSGVLPILAVLKQMNARINRTKERANLIAVPKRYFVRHQGFFNSAKHNGLSNLCVSRLSVYDIEEMIQISGLSSASASCLAGKIQHANYVCLGYRDLSGELTGWVQVGLDSSGSVIGPFYGDILHAHPLLKSALGEAARFGENKVTLDVGKDASGINILLEGLGLKKIGEGTEYVFGENQSSGSQEQPHVL